MEGSAPRSIILVVLSAFMSRKPVMVSAHGRTSKTTVKMYLHNAIYQLFGITYPPVLDFHQDSTVQDFLKIPETPGPVLILSHIDRLSPPMQTRLNELIRTRTLRTSTGDISLKDTVILCLGSSGKLIRLLRNTIFYELRFEPQPETVMEVFTEIEPQYIREYLQDMRPNLDKVKIEGEVSRYLRDIVLYLRTHRFVRGGVTPEAVRDFEFMVRLICLVQRREYATPSIINIAARRVMPLKIELVDPQDEPSLQYGGDEHVIKSWLAQWDTEGLVDTVLATVPTPL